MVVIVDPSDRGETVKVIDVRARGPHGLDLGTSRNRLYCACDDGTLVCLHSRSGRIVGTVGLSGDEEGSSVYAFLPESHQALVYWGGAR